MLQSVGAYQLEGLGVHLFETLRATISHSWPADVAAARLLPPPRDAAVSRRACVIGHPVGHSRSPLIHGYWLREHRIDGEYVREDVPPSEIGNFLDRLADKYLGANVTIPHKEAAFQKLKRPDAVATALGAANTLWFENGALCGSNTDSYGFLAHLDESLPGWQQRTKNAVVLGAGGAARAIVYALVSRKVGVVIINRTRARAEALMKHFGSQYAAAEWASLPSHLARADLVVNTTSLGMKGQPPLLLNLTPLHKARRSTTSFMCRWKRRSWRGPRARQSVIDGLGMLLTRPSPASSAGRRAAQVTPALRALVAPISANGCGHDVLGLPARSAWARRRRRNCSPTRAYRCSMRTPPCTGSMRRGRAADRSGLSRHDRRRRVDTGQAFRSRARHDRGAEQLEAIVHPLVRLAREQFLAQADEKSAPWWSSTFLCCLRPVGMVGSTDRGCERAGEVRAVAFWAGRR